MGGRKSLIFGLTLSRDALLFAKSVPGGGGKGDDDNEELVEEEEEEEEEEERNSPWVRCADARKRASSSGSIS